MIVAYGRRRLQNIALIFMVLILSVQFVVFITTTFHGQRNIFVYESGVCKCQAQALDDFRDTDIDSRIHEINAETESAQETAENIEIGKENTAKSIRQVSTGSKMALTSWINLRRPFTLRSTIKMTSVKSGLIISETNGNSLTTGAGHSNINKALSTVKYLPTIKRNHAEMTLRNSQTVQARSKERNNAQPNTREQKQKPPPKPLSNEKMVLSNGLKVVKQPTTKVLRPTPTEKRTTTTKLPMPTTKTVPSAMKTIKQQTVKAPSTILQKVPPAKKLTVNKATTTAKKVLPAARKSQISSIKKVPSSVLTDSKAPKNEVPQLNSKKVPQVTPNIVQTPTRMPRKTPPPAKRHIPKQTHNNTMENKPENKITTASTSDFTWKTLTKTLSIFSSYFDSRYLKTNEGLFQNSVVIFGYELGIFSKRNLSCVVIMQDDERLMLKEPALRIVLAETWKEVHNKHRAVMYRCNLTIAKAPRYVTLIDTGTYTELHSIPKTIFTPVVDPHFLGVTHEFGVCYETPLYGNKYDQGIMDSIEMNKLLGATWFTIYVYEANEKALEILRYYSQELKILDALLNWGVNMPAPVYNRGLLAGVHDCFYRNMYRVRYLVLCDFDEVIMPVKSLNWHELLLKINKPKFAYFVFRHLPFHKNLTKSTELLHCPGQSNLTYKMPRFFATHNRSESVFSGRRQSKSIAKPRFSTVVHVHYYRVMLPGYKAYIVPTDIALMNHFRDKDDPRHNNYNSTLDFSMDRFKPAILAAIEKHYCRNIKHVSR